jgi:hypothetical protein
MTAHFSATSGRARVTLYRASAAAPCRARALRQKVGFHGDPALRPGPLPTDRGAGEKWYPGASATARKRLGARIHRLHRRHAPKNPERLEAGRLGIPRSSGRAN